MNRPDGTHFNVPAGHPLGASEEERSAPRLSTKKIESAVEAAARNAHAYMVGLFEKEGFTAGEAEHYIQRALANVHISEPIASAPSPAIKNFQTSNPPCPCENCRAGQTEIDYLEKDIAQIRVAMAERCRNKGLADRRPCSDCGNLAFYVLPLTDGGTDIQCAACGEVEQA